MISTIYQINKKPKISGEVGLPKISTQKANISKLGIDGDYNNYRFKKKKNNPDMAIMILSLDIINNLNNEGWPIKPGDLGENITFTGINYSDFAPSKKYNIGSAIIEISFICDPCMSLKVLPYVGEKHINKFIKTLIKRRGWYARVLKSGKIKVGDQLQSIN